MDDDRSGALGCGCALPIGVILGLVAFALIGTFAGSPAPTGGAATEDFALALSESYLNATLASLSLGGETDTSEWQLDVLPDAQVSVQGMVTVSVMGQELSLPVRLYLGVAANDGRVEFSLASAELPAGVDAATAASMVNPLLDAANAEVEARLASALGQEWRVTGLSTDDDEVLVYLQEGSAS